MKTFIAVVVTVLISCPVPSLGDATTVRSGKSNSDEATFNSGKSNSDNRSGAGTGGSGSEATSVKSSGSNSDNRVAPTPVQEQQKVR